MSRSSGGCGTPSLIWSLALLSHKLERPPPAGNPELTCSIDNLCLYNRIGRDVQDKIGRNVWRECRSNRCATRPLPVLYQLPIEVIPCNNCVYERHFPNICCLSHNRHLSRRWKVDEFEMMNGIVRGQDWKMGWFEWREYARTGEVERCWTIDDGMYVDMEIEENWCTDVDNSNTMHWFFYELVYNEQMPYSVLWHVVCINNMWYDMAIYMIVYL